MVRIDYGVLAIGVGALVVTIIVGAVFLEPVPPVPEDPYGHITFSAQRNEHAIAETATFVLANQGPLTFSYTGWGIGRLVEENWVGADCLAFSLILKTLGPFDQLVFGWTIHEPEPFCQADLEAVFGPLLPFGPGRFTASIFLHIFDNERNSDVGPGRFLAEFDVV